MRSTYGLICHKHPELAGRRYLPNNACIKCHSEWNKAAHIKRKAERAAQAERLAKCEALLRDIDAMLDSLDVSPGYDIEVRMHEVLGDDS